MFCFVVDKTKEETHEAEKTAFDFRTHFQIVQDGSSFDEWDVHTDRLPRHHERTISVEHLLRLPIRAIGR